MPAASAQWRMASGTRGRLPLCGQATAPVAPAVGYGRGVAGDWYVRNLRDAQWRHADGRGAVCLVHDDFENVRASNQLGFNPFVLGPGEAMALYHRETDQEAFLVVSGEAVLIVEGEERPLRAWDFFHCPPGTRHVIVGAGSGPCVVIAAGSRERSEEPDALAFPADELAKRYGASVEQDTMDGGVAYAHVPPRQRTPYRAGWLPGD
jgi:mannose-6-phosphate isomerase-like protein (cupin superfamily)